MKNILKLVKIQAFCLGGITKTIFGKEIFVTPSIGLRDKIFPNNDINEIQNLVEESIKDTHNLYYEEIRIK